MILPTLTIMQPYASLLANGKKRFETRYRRTSKRGLVAIHAGRGQYAPPTDEAQEKYFELIRQSKELTGISFPCLPRGYIVGVAQLVACEYIIDANEERAILTDKRNNLAWIQIKIHIDQCFNARKIFARIFYFKFGERHIHFPP